MKNEILDDKKRFRRIGYGLFILLLATMVFQIGLSYLMVWLFPGIEQSPWFLAILIGIPLYCVGFPIFLWIMKKIPNGPKGEVEKISVKNIITLFFISMAGAYIFNLLGVIINNIISLIKGSDVVNPLDATLGTSSLIPIIIFAGILSPIVEEIIFRGVLLDKLRGYGNRTAIIFTSFTFALFHGNLSQFFYAFILGVIFAYVTIKTNTTKYAIILHIGVNILGSVIMPALALSGNLILTMVGGLLVIGFIAAGSGLFVSNFKKISLENPEGHVPIKVNKKLVYGNIGIILFYIGSLGLFIFTTMA